MTDPMCAARERTTEWIACIDEAEDRIGFALTRRMWTNVEFKWPTFALNPVRESSPPASRYFRLLIYHERCGGLYVVSPHRDDPTFSRSALIGAALDTMPVTIVNIFTRSNYAPF